MFSKNLTMKYTKDYFILTTNVDHQFQKTGFDKHKLFYTQGDYGLWQCSQPCHNETYDNEEAVIPREISSQSICVGGDIDEVLSLVGDLYL